MHNSFTKFLKIVASNL